MREPLNNSILLNKKMQNSTFDHTKAQPGDSFYYLKFLYTFPCNALYRALQSNPHGDKNLFLKLEGCILSGMSKKARECLGQMKAPQSPQILDSDQIILNNCFGNSNIVKEKEMVQQAVKQVPEDLSRFVTFVQQQQAATTSNDNVFALAETTCKQDEAALHACLNSNNAWQCYKQQVQLHLCFKTSMCSKQVSNCMDRSKHYTNPAERYLFCMENDRRVLACYRNATQVQTEEALLRNAKQFMHAALQFADFDGTTSSGEQFASHFAHLHKTMCAKQVQHMQQCQAEKRGDCANEEIALNFCLLTGLWYVI